MDKLDAILLEAWERVSARVRRDRVVALKRSRRRFSSVLTRPMREWCLVIRASDTRIGPMRAIVDPRNAIEHHEEHEVTLDGALIRRLTRPVVIPWPGVTYHRAAAMLGREYDTLFEWIKKGAFRINRYPEHGFPRDGKGRPYVWTPSPIDPNNFHGRAPHAVWGTLWQGLWEHLPEEYELKVQRVPRLRRQKTLDGRDMKFMGWEFVCPGRLNADGELGGRGRGCGRRCTYLYGPQTVWTLAQAIGMQEGFDMPQDSGLSGQWHPGLSDPIKAAAGGQRSFACKHCWGVRSACMANDTGWNEFITQISGGLLTGRDVKRPLDICPILRKKRRYRRTPRRPDEQAARRAG